MALLAAYMKTKSDGESLGDFLENRVFKGESGETLSPDIADVNGFNDFMRSYNAGLAAERAAVDGLK